MPVDLFVGNGGLTRILHIVKRAAPTSVSVLITGESGTGKELVAKTIHRESTRASGPFVAVNCAAIPEGLIESELFGHIRGAFTGASADRKGKFEMANRGTIFLDEIGDMSLKTQAKVLRVLQEHTFEAVGSTKQVTVDVRVIAATNRDLKDDIREERFRSDLYYRVNVIPIHLPPLRERLSDIRSLVEHFLVSFGGGGKRISEDAMRELENFKWPGNIRQLRNAVEYAIVMAEDEITGNDLPGYLTESIVEESATVSHDDNMPTQKELVDDYHRRLFKKCEGNKLKGALISGLSRGTIYRIWGDLGLIQTGQGDDKE